ncbi:MAG: hypothetical protein HY814_06570 [Candidatus Riflebacteria bacterium]|nr:hypothetical protein [Candidatus Riflebacteria bacterium]
MEFRDLGRYPFPIASVLRQAELAESPRERWSHLVSAVQFLLRFLAAASIQDYLAASRTALGTAERQAADRSIQDYLAGGLDVASTHVVLSEVSRALLSVHLAASRGGKGSPLFMPELPLSLFSPPDECRSAGRLAKTAFHRAIESLLRGWPSSEGRAPEPPKANERRSVARLESTVARLLEGANFLTRYTLAHRSTAADPPSPDQGLPAWSLEILSGPELSPTLGALGPAAGRCRGGWTCTDRGSARAQREGSRTGVPAGPDPA